MLKTLNRINLYNKNTLTAYYNINHVLYSSSSNNVEKGFDKKPNVLKIQADYIGPPDEKSNIRPILRHIPKNETKAQEKLRFKQMEAETFLMNFWTNHNKRFFNEKSDFIAKRQNKDVNADEMSEFYKDFLDKNWQSHFYFNIMWYMKNFELLYLSFLVNIEKQIQRIKK